MIGVEHSFRMSYKTSTIQYSNVKSMTSNVLLHWVVITHGTKKRKKKKHRRTTYLYLKLFCRARLA